MPCPVVFLPARRADPVSPGRRPWRLGRRGRGRGRARWRLRLGAIAGVGVVRRVVWPGAGGRRLRYFGRDSCNTPAYSFGYGRVVVWARRSIRLARIWSPPRPSAPRGRCAKRRAPQPAPRSGSSGRSNVYGWRGAAKALVTKDFSGFAPECAALGARVRALRKSRDTRGPNGPGAPGETSGLCRFHVGVGQR